MCLEASKLRKWRWDKSKIWKNSKDAYWNMILHIKETALKVKKKHCDVSSLM